MRVLKDIVLCRLRAFNPAALVDFVANVWEEYFAGRLMEFADNRRHAPRLFYTKLLCKMPAGSEEKIEHFDDDNSYLVPSGQSSVLSYEVRADIGWCSCPAGSQGAFCKHQVLVHEKFGGLFPNAPLVNSRDRYELAQLALGSECPSPAFFLGLTENPESAPVTAESSLLIHGNAEQVICLGTMLFLF